MTDKEEYDRFISPDIGAMKERIRKAISAGIESAKQRDFRKRKMMELRARQWRRKEVTDNFDI